MDEKTTYECDQCHTQTDEDQLCPVCGHCPDCCECIAFTNEDRALFRWMTKVTPSAAERRLLFS